MSLEDFFKPLQIAVLDPNTRLIKLVTNQGHSFWAIYDSGTPLDFKSYVVPTVNYRLTSRPGIQPHSSKHGYYEHIGKRGSGLVFESDSGLTVIQTPPGGSVSNGVEKFYESTEGGPCTEGASSSADGTGYLLLKRSDLLANPVAASNLVAMSDDELRALNYQIGFDDLVSLSEKLASTAVKLQNFVAAQQALKTGYENDVDNLKMYLEDYERAAGGDPSRSETIDILRYNLHHRMTYLRSLLCWNRHLLDLRPVLKDLESRLDSIGPACDQGISLTGLTLLKE